MARSSEITGPSTWLVAANRKKYDAESALRDRTVIDWSETGNAHIAVGDTVYLYSSEPTSALTHQLKVVEREIPLADVIDDRPYWRQAEFLNRKERTWMRLRLVRRLDVNQRTDLHLDRLLEVGLKAAPQGRQRAQGQLLALITEVSHRTPPLSHGGPTDDAAAERAPFDPPMVVMLEAQLEAFDYAVPDAFVTAKTRGSAQRVFARAVKNNYEHRCAVTGISTPDFLVASHIVPWAEDESIRLDPSNGICLSTLVDRAFDTNYLRITPDCVVVINRERCKDDPALLAALEPLDGQRLRRPAVAAPGRDYLARRGG